MHAPQESPRRFLVAAGFEDCRLFKICVEIAERLWKSGFSTA
jgi:hypothetical protein